MATTIFQSIKKGMIAAFKGLFPEFDVFCEEIPRTRSGGPEPDLEDYVFLDIIPGGNETLDPCHTYRRVLVAASLHTKPERNSVYLAMAQEIDSALRPVFRFEDGGEARAVTVHGLDFKIVDGLLHCTFTLAFIDSKEEPPQPPVMEELATAIKRR